MASRVNVEMLMGKKERAIEKAMDKKERSIEFSNSLNNAVLVWTTLANHSEINVNAALEEIRDIQQVLLGFKGEPEPLPETTIMAEAEKTVKDVFPDSQVQSPQGGSRIKDPGSPSSEPQRKMIWAIMSRLGKSDDEKKVMTSGLTKGMASSRIESLLAQAAKEGK
jgi:hypothetical protein